MKSNEMSMPNNSARTSKISSSTGAEAASSAIESVQKLGDTVSTKVHDQYDNVQKYIHDTDFRSAVDDLKQLAKKHPIAATAVGLGFGVLLGKVFRRR